MLTDRVPTKNAHSKESPTKAGQQREAARLRSLRSNQDIWRRERRRELCWPETETQKANGVRGFTGQIFQGRGGGRRPRRLVGSASSTRVSEGGRENRRMNARAVFGELSTKKALGESKVAGRRIEEEKAQMQKAERERE